MTSWCCLTVLILAKSGASTKTSYIAPQPPLTSTTAMSVAEGKAEARAAIRLSSAADLDWKFIAVLWKHLDGAGIVIHREGVLRSGLDEGQWRLLEEYDRGRTVCEKERDCLIILLRIILALQIF